jgi:UDP-N-acetylglucosamine 2-epimerase (non-hydrolysing)
VIGSISSEQILQAVTMAVELHKIGDDASEVPAYVDETVSTKVIKLIQSYTGIVNKMVWRK